MHEEPFDGTREDHDLEFLAGLERRQFPRRSPGFTNGGGDEVELTKVVPFLVEDEMMRLGANFSKVKNWAVHTVVDGQLITGQNPASSGPAARLLIDVLNKRANSVKAVA